MKTQVALVSLSSVALAFVGTTNAFILPVPSPRQLASAVRSPVLATPTALWAAADDSAGEKKSGGKKKRRVRKVDTQRGSRSEGEKKEAEAAAVRPAAPVRSPEELKARAEADEMQKKRVEGVIKRDFDRTMLQEEFVDGTEAFEEESGSTLSKKFRFDPTFDLPIKSEGTMDLSDVKGPGSLIDPLAKPDSSVLLPKSLVEVGKRVKQKDGKERKQESKRLFGFEPEVLAKEMEPLDEYDLTSGVLGDSRDVMGVGLPFLQSSHTVWLLVALLCAFVEFPGFPLTTLPLEIRGFLKMGMVVIYAINAVLAFDAIKLAQNRDQNVPFWVLKTFLLGALAHNELHLIREKKSGQI